jgi:hypothetical protein
LHSESLARLSASAAVSIEVRHAIVRAFHEQGLSSRVSRPAETSGEVVASVSHVRRSPAAILSPRSPVDRPRWTEQDARVVLAALERSGKPVRMFAEEHVLDAQRLNLSRAGLARSPEATIPHSES